MDDGLRVSVIMPVHDVAGHLLEAAVASVLAQGPWLERLVIIDDGSRAAGTLAALDAAASQPGVLRITLPRNRGVSAARNAGIDAAPSDWIGFCDADDLAAPGWLEAAAAAHRRYPAAQWIMGRYETMLGDGHRLPMPTVTATAGQAFAPDGALFHAGPGLTALLITDCICHLGTMVVRRELLVRAGRFAETLAYHEDHLMVLRLSRLYPLIELDAPAYVYRRGGPSVTNAPRALTSAMIAGWRLARRDPLLRDFRKPLRWAAYAGAKALALKNLHRGRRAAALGFALRAWATDPREFGELATFLRLMSKDSAEIARDGARYSGVPLESAPTSPR